MVNKSCDDNNKGTKQGVGEEKKGRKKNRKRNSEVGREIDILKTYRQILI